MSLTSFKDLVLALILVDKVCTSVATDSVQAVKYQEVDSSGNKVGKQKDILSVVCGDGSVLGVLELQPSGKKVMDAKSFINGTRGRTLQWRPVGDQMTSNS